MHKTDVKKTEGKELYILAKRLSTLSDEKKRQMEQYLDHLEKQNDNQSS